MLGNLLVLGFALAIAGCTSTPRVWYKAGGTQSEFDADKKECVTRANALRGRFTTNFAQEGTFDDCMTARGWMLRQEPPKNTASPNL